MGIAVSEADEAECEAGSSDETDGSVSQEETDAASACISFWERVGRETGAKGVRLSAGLAQQAGVEQCLESQPLQQQLEFALLTFAAALARVVGTFCETRTNPSKITSTVFANRNAMVLGWSVCFAVPYSNCQIVGRVGIIFGLLQSGINPVQPTALLRLYLIPVFMTPLNLSTGRANPRRVGLRIYRAAFHYGLYRANRSSLACHVPDAVFSQNDEAVGNRREVNGSETQAGSHHSGLGKYFFGFLRKSVRQSSLQK
jgi:hypothetical protein